MSESAFDILIVGGGVMGSAVAYFLAASPEGSHLKVGVVEPDPTYAASSTALSVGGIRQQFSTPENVLLSAFGARFFRQASDLLAVEGEGAELNFMEAGYLFLASPAGLETLRENQRRQRELGAEVLLLTPEELRDRFPWLEVGDLAGGGLGISGEGWVDPYSLLQGLRKKAISLGVEYLTDRVVALGRARDRVEEARLASGVRVPLSTLVNAAGPRAREVAEMAGIPDVPVHPRKRFVYRIRCRETLPDSPLTVDPSGVYFRPEGPDFLCGVSPPADQDPDTLDLKMSYHLFEEVVWPTLAHRVPAFQALKLASSWAGHYAVNTQDQNAILGPHPAVPNFHFVSGFSGHGLQHAPGVGRGISELILFGGYRTLDLSRFGFSRFATGRLLLEKNVV